MRQGRIHRAAVLIMALFLCVVRFPDAARAAGTGELLCSAGTKDGQPCETQGDCPGGACVTALGVCNAPGAAVNPCDCPSGPCSAGLPCASGSGTCVGGPPAGACCEVLNNCTGDEPCVGTQKICVGNGTNKGLQCLNDTQCSDAGPCSSTGRVCTPCPHDACVAPAAVAPLTPTLTATPTRTVPPSPTPLRTALTVPPGDGGRLYGAVGEGGCSTDAGSDRSSLALLIGALVVWAVRKRRDA
jgi:hypothetical protein